MDCSYVTNPNLSGSNTYFLNTGSNCTHTGVVLTGFPIQTGYLQYLFGPNIYKQIMPVSYDNSNNIIQLSTQYDPTKYIAEVFSILDETPEGVSFLSTGNYQLTTSYITNVYTASIINTPVPITLTMLPT